MLPPLVLLPFPILLPILVARFHGAHLPPGTGTQVASSPALLPSHKWEKARPRAVRQGPVFQTSSLSHSAPAIPHGYLSPSPTPLLCPEACLGCRSQSPSLGEAPQSPPMGSLWSLLPKGAFTMGRSEGISNSPTMQREEGGARKKDMVLKVIVPLACFWSIGSASILLGGLGSLSPFLIQSLI